MGDHNRMVAALGSPNLMEATNAAGILCTILSLDCQSTRTAISSSPLIVTNIEKALSGTGDLPHNAALLVSMLSTITSFRRSWLTCRLADKVRGCRGADQLVICDSHSRQR